MTLKELADAGGVTERTVRYLVAQDLVPASPRRGRGADAYGATHLDSLRECKRLIDAGMSVPAIRAMRRAVVPADGSGDVIFRDDRFEVRLTRGDALRGLREADLPALLAAFERALANALAASGETLSRSDLAEEEAACP